MNLVKSGLKQFELVAEAFSILLHAAYLNRFLLRISFPNLMEVRTDIREEMHYAGWHDLNYGPCYWIDLARYWIPVNLTVCTHSAVPSSDSVEFLPACRFMTVIFASVTYIQCFVLLCVLVKNGHGHLLEYSAFCDKIRLFNETRGELQGLAMGLLFTLIFALSLFGPYCLISFGIASIQRYCGDSAVLPGGALLLLCLMLYNILGLLGVWNIRLRYEQVATLVGLQRTPIRVDATHRSAQHTENMRVDLFQQIVASTVRLAATLYALCAMGFWLRLDYPDASVVFSTGWWTGLTGPLQTAPRGLEMLGMDDARLSHWYNITEKFANPSHHPGLTDPISPLAQLFGSIGWHLSELFLSCFFGMFTASVVFTIAGFNELVAIQIREYFWQQQSRQYIAVDHTYSHGPLTPLSDKGIVMVLLTMYTVLSATRTVWTSAALAKVVQLLVPERWHLVGYLLLMLWLTGQVVKGGRELVKRAKPLGTIWTLRMHFCKGSFDYLSAYGCFF